VVILICLQFIMAKKGHRILIWLVCTECGRKNYTQEKNKLNTPTKMELNKHCMQCRKHTTHKETLKLK